MNIAELSGLLNSCDRLYLQELPRPQLTCLGYVPTYIQLEIPVDMYMSTI